ISELRYGNGKKTFCCECFFSVSSQNYGIFIIVLKTRLAVICTLATIEHENIFINNIQYSCERNNLYSHYSA
ncbi:MAG: hypothetical protein LBH32_08245, partial [Dysgonamonadaceae bacterium]|nr:hypothetical protein [Dysgonamonadaceae bacterium]